jgi:hypothetical protein
VSSNLADVKSFSAAFSFQPDSCSQLPDTPVCFSPPALWSGAFTETSPSDAACAKNSIFFA